MSIRMLILKPPWSLIYHPSSGESRESKIAWVVIHNAVNHAMERASGCTGDGTPDLDVFRQTISTDSLSALVEK